MSNTPILIRRFGEVHEVTIEIAFFRNDNTPAVYLKKTLDNKPLCSISSHLAESKSLPSNTFFVKTWGENYNVIPQLEDYGILVRRHDLPSIKPGFVVAHVYELKSS